MSERTFRAVLLAISVFHILQGALAMIAPDTFFDVIGDYGVENSHYIGDNGAFTLAIGLVMLLAIQRPSWRVPLLSLTAAWYGLHALNHVFDTGEAKSSARGISDTVLLAFGGLLAAWLARVAEEIPGGKADGA